MQGRLKRNMLKSPSMISPDEYAEAALADMEQDMDEIRTRKK
jgi:hypothetical protein